MRTSVLLLISLAIAISSTVGNAQDAQELIHNPFSRPPSRVSPSERLSLQSANSTQTLELLATMVASDHSLANIAGQIIHPGDEIQGYTLLQVFEDHAVFIREGSRLTVYVNPNLEEDRE